MAILALTSFGQLIGLPSALVCAHLMVYLLAAPLPRSDKRVGMAMSKAFVFASLAFAAIWFWMGGAFFMIAWLFFLGDNNHWFYDHVSDIAAVVALAVSCAAFLRTTLGSASQLYVSSLAWIPPILLVTAGAVSIENTLSSVEGLTPESAAARVFKTNVPRISPTMRLEAHAGPPMHSDTPSDHKTFWIVEGREKVGLIVVRPNPLLGWQHSRSHRFGDSMDILIDAQVYIELGENVKARYCLEQIIKNLPGTPAEKEARRLLASIDTQMARKRP